MKALCSRSRRLARRRRGVTLVEVLIVISILALISGSVGIYALKQHRKAQFKTAAVDARKIRSVAMIWRNLDNHPDECPTVERLVEEQELDEAGDNRDPWGKDYVVECGEGVSVRSAGPDRTLQTDDDVVIPHT